MTILETVSESSNRQDGREESLRQENAALKCAFEDKERQVKRLQEEINQLKSEAAQGSTALSDLRLEKLQLLERAEAFEHLLEERSQYLVDTTFSFEQQAIKHQLTISKLEDELWDANQKAAFLRGKVRSGVEELESNCRRLWRLELTLQSLTIFLKWQADVTQQESCKTRELENTIYQMSSALHQKVEDEAEQNQKMLLLREELQNQKSRSANLEERMQLVEESHRTTRKHLDQKEAQLLLTLEKLEDAKKLIRIQEIEAKRIDLKLRDTQERLDRANLQFEEKIREHEKHAEVCKNLTRGNIARGADEIASTSTSISKKEELDTSSQSEVLELENGDESASRFSRTEAVNESNTLASCFKSISSTCEAKALKEKNESYAESPKRSNIAPKGLSAWIDEEYDALAITSTDDEDSQSNLWLEFDAARYVCAFLLPPLPPLVFSSAFLASPDKEVFDEHVNGIVNERPIKSLAVVQGCIQEGLDC